MVECRGNLTPHPGTLLALVALGEVVISGIASALGLQVDDPRPGQEDTVLTMRSLMTGDGVH